MKPFEIHSDHDPETWLRLWDSKIVEFTSKNKGAYSGERCFFGTHEKNQLMVFSTAIMIPSICQHVLWELLNRMVQAVRSAASSVR